MCEELDIHFRRIEILIPEIKSYLPFNESDFDDTEKIKTIDSFIYRLEKLELIESSDDWIEYRKLRNTLTHEYPDNVDEIIEAINLSVEAYSDMKDIYKK